MSQATARRVTLGAGEAALAVCEGEVERLKQEVPQAPGGADKQLLSADGAMGHLVGGEWAEVKTLVRGEVTRNKRGEVCTQRISSFSRLADAERFAEAALVETHRRGLERAAEGCARWSGVAARAGGLPPCGCGAHSGRGPMRPARAAILARPCEQQEGDCPPPGGRRVLHRLKHQGPARVLKHLARVVARSPSPLAQEQLTYLQKREAHMQYPISQAAGWPIGSGSVESANKGVVEARLKGAGMRLPSAERHPHAGATQRRLQSAVEPDVDDSGGSSTSASHESAASRQPTAADPRLLDARLLGSTAVAAVPSTCPRCHLTGG